MARRSPMNPRYQKDAQVGTTRKSAASAKPKRTASSGSSSSKSSGSARRGTGTSTGRIELPPETKKLQRTVFILLGIAVVLSAFYLLAENRGWLGSLPPIVGSITIGVSYALLFTAIYIDLTKVRPVTRALRSGQPLPTKASTSSSAAGNSGSKGTWTDWIPMLGGRTKTKASAGTDSTTQAESDNEGKDA